MAPFGISGLETAFGSLMKLVHGGKLPLPVIIEKLTAAPAQIIGDKHGISGSLKLGDPADIVIFNPDVEWVVDTTKFVSKGRNTPLAGETLKGKVIMTIFGGNIVFQEELKGH